MALAEWLCTSAELSAPLFYKGKGVLMGNFKVKTDYIEDWLVKKVDKNCQAVILKVLDAFEELGPLSRSERLPRSRTKPLFYGISEIRVKQFRIGYFWDGSTCVLLHGIRKKRDSWPQKDIQILKKRKRDYLNS
jgi:phage-related protein